jgi:hypothetical protein
MNKIEVLLSLGWGHFDLTIILGTRDDIVPRVFLIFFKREIAVFFSPSEEIPFIVGDDVIS